METNPVSLQDKIQKLINEYKQDKEKLETLQKQNENLSEENKQLMAQIESMSETSSGSNKRIQELEVELQSLRDKYQELQDTVSGFENIATDAISKIDDIFPELKENK